MSSGADLRAALNEADSCCPLCGGMFIKECRPNSPAQASAHAWPGHAAARELARTFGLWAVAQSHRTAGNFEETLDAILAGKEPSR